MIEITNLDFQYRQGDFRLQIEQLKIDKGSTVAIIGPSGTGKTTLLNLIAGVLVPKSGRIQIGEVDLAQFNDTVRRDFRIVNIGLVFQEFELLEYLNVMDNILVPYRITGALHLDRSVKARATELAGQVGIAELLNRFTMQMSQGEKQRVAVCRAILPGPHLLLADEPTGNLDPVNKGRVLDILFQYVNQTGATMATVTHDHDLIGRFDRVIDFQEFDA